MTDFIEKLANKQNRDTGDYIGENGLLCCGKCRGPKEARIDGFAKPVPIPCQCRDMENRKKAEEQKKKRVEELRVRCLPVEAMHKRTFGIAGEEKHIQTVRRYVEKWQQVSAENIGLLLWGNTGTGKTFAAQCIANALIDREVAVMYISATELVASLDVPMSADDPAGNTLGDLVSDPDGESAYNTLEDADYNRALREALEAALDTIDQPCADAIRRRWFDGQTQQEIAASCGVVPQMIHNRERRGFSQLRRCKARKLLKDFNPYHGTGYNAWLHTGESIQERYLILQERHQRSENEARES